jgi:flagellar biosynthesis activator protein FlaF
MHHAAQAYGKVAHKTASPRELEANLLLRAAAQLQTVQDTWTESTSKLNEALFFNRQLWSILLASVVENDHPLPREIRQNVANLGVFVMTQTLSIMSEPQPEKLGYLININRELAAGLMGRG